MNLRSVSSTTLKAAVIAAIPSAFLAYTFWLPIWVPFYAWVPFFAFFAIAFAGLSRPGRRPRRWEKIFP
ncbi:MAG TPA: hypothetical protein VMT66_12210 [Steroidobacteraceae bacterium]|nr:hypothetical protein [Steroidobacteraceae bacterium]